MTKPISTSFSGAISVIETKIAALEKASNLAAEVLEVRLHSMNEFRTQLKDQAASFVRREEHETVPSFPRLLLALPNRLRHAATAGGRRHLRLQAHRGWRQETWRKCIGGDHDRLSQRADQEHARGRGIGWLFRDAWGGPCGGQQPHEAYQPCDGRENWGKYEV